MNCLICNSKGLIQLGMPGIYPKSITSEPRICNYPSDLWYCPSCGHIQKNHTQEIVSYINKVYSEYSAHYLSDGGEQLVFPAGLPPRPRTYHALQCCTSYLPKKGKLLDFGCGTGAALISASQLLPQWTMYGYDLSPLFKDDILKIPQVKGFYSGSLSDIQNGPFDLIILWQVLEHLADPVYYLSELKKHLTETGMILISVPDTERNPFDLAVIDHCSHFSLNSLDMLLQQTGFGIKVDGRNWFHNLLTCLITNDISHHINQNDVPSPERYVIWLKETAKFFNKTIDNNRYAIFGTGMSSFWLYSQMNLKPEFFLDEDERRIHKEIDGIKIIHPQDLIDNSIPIIIPFIRGTGLEIVNKIRNNYLLCRSFSFVLAPEMIDE